MGAAKWSRIVTGHSTVAGNTKQLDTGPLSSADETDTRRRGHLEQPPLGPPQEPPEHEHTFFAQQPRKAGSGLI